MKRMMALWLAFVLVLSLCAPVCAYGFHHNGTALQKATAYRLPKADSRDIWWVDKDDKLEVFCKDGDYYLVLYPFLNTGKHVLAYVQTSAVSASNIPDAFAFYKNEIARTNTQATLYHNPSTDVLTGSSGSNQTQRALLSKGQEVTILFEKDGFYCVQTESDTGFVEKGKICAHSKTTRQLVSSGDAVQADDRVHQMKNVYREVCADCGLVVNTRVEVLEKENHTAGAVCEKCGYATSAAAGHRYKIFDESMTWEEAKKACENLGGHLVTITSAEEQKQIEALLSSGGKKQYWIGAVKNGGAWQWVSGEHFGYTNWCAGQPDGYEKDSNYGQILKEVDKKAVASCRAYSWNDITNTNDSKSAWYFAPEHVGYICEWDNAADADQKDECRHENTYLVGNTITYGSPEPNMKIKDAEYHISYYYADEYCTACKKLIRQKVIAEEETPHAYLNGVCTACLYSNYTEKPSASTVSINKTSFAPNEEIRLEWTFSDRATGYDIHIVKAGQDKTYRIISCTGAEATVKLEEEGSYSLAVYATNNVGYTGGANWVKFEVKKPNTTKTGYVYNTGGVNLNLRAKPTTASSIVAKMPEGTALTVTGDVTAGFYPVSYNGKAGYASAQFITFNKPSAAVTNTSYVWPASGGYFVYVLDNYFGKKGQAHPTKGKGSILGSVDIAVRGNALAAASGTVISTVYSNSKSGWGNNVTVRHDDGTYSFYAHLAKINVSKNQKVKAGQNLGIIGTTGNSTGIHLHFEIWDKNGNTTYTIDHFKEKYKKQLIYDGDIVTGGGNNASMRTWIQNNYKKSGGRWVCK